MHNIIVGKLWIDQVRLTELKEYHQDPHISISSDLIACELSFVSLSFKKKRPYTNKQTEVQHKKYLGKLGGQSNGE